MINKKTASLKLEENILDIIRLLDFSNLTPLVHYLYKNRRIRGKVKEGGGGLVRISYQPSAYSVQLM